MHLHETIDLAYEQDHAQQQRSHLGISTIGKQCARALWYGLHHCTTVQHDGRKLRLFARGHAEEQTMINNLRTAGWRVMPVDPRTNRQWSVQDPDNALFYGSLDAICVSPADDEIDQIEPSTPYVFDFKTMNKSNFNAFVKHGLFSAHPHYWYQLQCYMGFSDQLGKPIKQAVLLAVCKDDDRLFSEVVLFDQNAFEFCRQKADMITNATQPPMKSEGMYCKWCDHADVCGGNVLPDVTCRTCGHYSITTNKCDMGYTPAPCADHLYLPALVGGDVVQYHKELKALEYTGIVNGNPAHKGKFGDKPVYSSSELLALSKIDDTEQLEKLMAMFNARIDHVEY